MLKSDYFRIEITSLPQCNPCLLGLKSDYFRIEILEIREDEALVGTLKSDYFRIEMFIPEPFFSAWES